MGGSAGTNGLDAPVGFALARVSCFPYNPVDFRMLNDFPAVIAVLRLTSHPESAQEAEK